MVFKNTGVFSWGEGARGQGVSFVCARLARARVGMGLGCAVLCSIAVFNPMRARCILAVESRS